jgi:predicted Zn-dependent peptidase
MEDHELPLISLSIKMKTSPADEEERQAGLLGLFGQIWRSGGTKNHTPDQLNEALERMASTVETGAGAESATISLDTLTRHQKASLALFKEVMFEPRFQDDQVVLAKGKAIEALRRKNDDPASIGRRAFRDILYGDHHVYAREASEESLKNISRGDLLKMHSALIAPDHAIVTVVGDFETSAMLSELESLFAKWKPTGRAIAPYDYSLKDPRPGALFYVEKKVNQSRVTFGRVGVARHNPDHFRLSVADYILGGGGASRLFGQIRSRLGLAYAVGSFVTEANGPGIIGLGAQTKSASTVQIVEAIRAELVKFGASEPTSDELELAKESISNSFVFNFNSAEAIAGQKADLEFYSYPENYLNTYLDNIRGVSGADVLSTAKKYYLPDNMRILVVGDKSQFGRDLHEAGDVVEIPLTSIR